MIRWAFGGTYEGEHVVAELEIHRSTGWVLWESTMRIYKPGPNFSISSDYGYREFPDGKGGVIKEMHRGVDHQAYLGTPIPCAADGVVVGRGYHDAFGWMLIVRHDDPLEFVGKYTAYAHLAWLRNTPLMRTRVFAGEAIGCVGDTGRSTGPHLHLELIHAAGWFTPVLGGRGGGRRDLWDGGATELGAQSPARVNPEVEANWHGLEPYMGTGMRSHFGDHECQDLSTEGGRQLLR
ncbi:MAG: M23 family metallopeptidase [Myxococcota bacterium]